MHIVPESSVHMQKLYTFFLVPRNFMSHIFQKNTFRSWSPDESDRSMTGDSMGTVAASQSANFRC